MSEFQYGSTQRRNPAPTSSPPSFTICSKCPVLDPVLENFPSREGACALLQHPPLHYACWHQHSQKQGYTTEDTQRAYPRLQYADKILYLFNNSFESTVLFSTLTFYKNKPPSQSRESKWGSLPLQQCWQWQMVHQDYWIFSYEPSHSGVHQWFWWCFLLLTWKWCSPKAVFSQTELKQSFFIFESSCSQTQGVGVTCKKTPTWLGPGVKN